MVSRANVAAQLMEHLCTCPHHGYSQPGRYGVPGSGFCEVATDAGVIPVARGDRDCSSAVSEVWELALRGTPFEGRITRYHSTYDMRRTFVDSGLFSWEPMSFYAVRGDAYLDEDAHTSLCLCGCSACDVLGEFSLAETGGIDGEPGDQTGRESSIGPYYAGWDGILHYNGGADDNAENSGGGTAAAGALPMPRYRGAVMIDGKKTWLEWCEGLYCTDGCGDNFGGIPGVGMADFEVDASSLGGGWFKVVRDGERVIGLVVYYSTPDPDSTGWYVAHYRVHWMGANPGWGKWERDDEDGGAGNDCDQVDMVQLTICVA